MPDPIRKIGTVVDVNRIMSAGYMYTYVLIAVDGGGVESARGNAYYYPDVAFAQFGQKVEYATSGVNLSGFTILWDKSPRPWEGDVRMPANRAS